MADLSYLNKNNEQRCQTSSVGTLQATMPGGQALEEGVAHVIGAIPPGALLKGWTAYVDGASGWAVTATIGTESDPDLFATALGVSVVNVNDKTAPFEFYFPDGEKLVCSLTSVGQPVPEGIFQFVLDYTEVPVTLGAYTA